MSRFNLPAISTSSATTPAYTPAYIASPVYGTDDEDEEDNLPYPTELPRSDFLKPDFDPQEYLSSLRNRHQALEDLRSDLRARSQLLNQELLDLVNGNYEEFLSLGADLNGGEEKVEGVTIGLLGFTKEIEGLKAIVAAREHEFGGLLSEAKDIKREIMFGRKLLATEASLSTLEDTLGITGGDVVDGMGDLEDDVEEDDTAEATLVLRRLHRRAEQYTTLEETMQSLGSDQPYIASLQPRLDVARKTLLLDMSAALRQAKASKDADDLLDLTRLFGELGSPAEALQVLTAT